MSRNSGFHHTEETIAKLRQANLGKTISDEVKAKISCGMKGKKNGLGYHFTEEQRFNLSQAKMGKKTALGYRFTEEQRTKCSKAHMGKKHTEEAKAKISLAMMGNKHSLGHHCTKETRAKISHAHMGIPMPEELKARLVQISRARICRPETRLKLSLAGTGKTHTEETKAKMSQARIGIIFTEEHRAKISKNKKAEWQNPEYRDRVIRAQRLGCHIRPNKPETLLFRLLESIYPSEWRFVGDGSLVIGGKNPDFANINGRKELIELFGDYWHMGENPQDRIDIFKGYGFKTLVIWESELKYPSKVVKKLLTQLHTSIRVEE